MRTLHESLITPSFCEEYAARYSRLIRIAVAAHLVQRHGLTQVKAARLTGVQQPMLNYVLRGHRRPQGLDELEKLPGFQELVEWIAQRLLAGESVDMCTICHRLLSLMGKTCPTKRARNRVKDPKGEGHAAG